MHNVRGPISFADLKTVDDITYSTFEESCRARNLLVDDLQWELTMEEAVSTVTANELRELFAIVIVFCMLPNPVDLWERFKNDMTYDIHRQMQLQFGSDTPINFSNSMYNECLLRIQTYPMGED